MSLTQIRSDISTRPMVMRVVSVGQRVSQVVQEAGLEFMQATGHAAQFAFVRAIPNGAQEGFEVQGVMLIQADWVPVDQVAVGAGGTEAIDQEARSWKRK